MWTSASPRSRSESVATTSRSTKQLPLRCDAVDIKPILWQSPRQSLDNLMTAEMAALKSPAFSELSPPLSPALEAQSDSRNTNDETEDDTTTLDGNEDTTSTKPAHTLTTTAPLTEPASPLPAPYIPGPLESQLAALMSKLVYLEHANPAVSVSPEEYAALQARLREAEADKERLWERYEAVWRLRDEDLGNIVKIRGMLAATRRELEATQGLRDGDLNNLHIVRQKLAEKTREWDALKNQTSPVRARPASVIERRNTSDLFTAAKTAALEQRVLELEKRNAELVGEVETFRNTKLGKLEDTRTDEALSIGTMPRSEGTNLLSASRSGKHMLSIDWHNIELMLEEHANYREMMGGSLQALRSEKEGLQRDLHRKEHECSALELRVQTLQRKMLGRFGAESIQMPL